MRAVAITTIFVIVSLVVAGHAQTSDAPLVRMDYGDTAHPSRFTELERGGNTSTIKVVQEKGGGTVGQSMFVLLACYQVAQARHYQYFVNLREWPDKDGGQIYLVGFANKKDAGIKEEFGPQHDETTGPGRKRGYLSVSEWGSIFEKMHIGSQPSAPGGNASQKPEPTP